MIADTTGRSTTSSTPGFSRSSGTVLNRRPAFALGVTETASTIKKNTRPTTRAHPSRCTEEKVLTASKRIMAMMPMNVRSLLLLRLLLLLSLFVIFTIYPASIEIGVVACLRLLALFFLPPSFDIAFLLRQQSFECSWSLRGFAF